MIATCPTHGPIAAKMDAASGQVRCPKCGVVCEKGQAKKEGVKG